MVRHCYKYSAPLALIFNHALKVFLSPQICLRENQPAMRWYEQEKNV